MDTCPLLAVFFLLVDACRPIMFNLLRVGGSDIVTGNLRGGAANSCTFADLPSLPVLLPPRGCSPECAGIPPAAPASSSALHGHFYFPLSIPSCGIPQVLREALRHSLM